MVVNSFVKTMVLKSNTENEIIVKQGITGLKIVTKLQEEYIGLVTQIDNDAFILFHKGITSVVYFVQIAEVFYFDTES